MIGDMEDDIMSQVQTLLSDQMIEVITEIKYQLTSMISDIVKELVSAIVKKHSVQTRSSSIKRMGRDTDNDEHLSRDSEEEVYSEVMENGNDPEEDNVLILRLENSQ